MRHFFSVLVLVGRIFVQVRRSNSNFQHQIHVGLRLYCLECDEIAYKGIDAAMNKIKVEESCR